MQSRLTKLTVGAGKRFRPDGISERGDSLRAVGLRDTLSVVAPLTATG
jgi:hypothetical protein